MCLSLQAGTGDANGNSELLLGKRLEISTKTYLTTAAGLVLDLEGVLHDSTQRHRGTVSVLP
jgi:hypothetical protein